LCQLQARSFSFAAMVTFTPDEKCINFARLYDYTDQDRCCANLEARPSIFGDKYICEEPAKPKKVKAELSGGSARTFFRIIIHKLLYYYMFITIVAHSLFSAATGPRRMALTVNRVHNNNIYTTAAFAFALHPWSSTTTVYIVRITNASLSL